MAEAKHSGLNGAYYGPSIPPPQSYHSQGRGRGCCGPCCLLCLLLKIIATIVVLAVIGVIVLWVIYRPTKFKFHVVDANLSEFNLTSNNHISYNLALDLSVRNPNRKIGFYYDILEAKAFYEDEQFATTMLDRFFQRRKTTTLVKAVFRGNSTILLGGSDVRRFDKEKSDGIFNIDVKINLRIRPRIGDFISGHMKPKVKCDVRVPLAANRASAGVFETKRCSVDFW